MAGSTVWTLSIPQPCHGATAKSITVVIKCIYPGPVLLKKPMSGGSARCLLTEGPLEASPSPLDSQQHTRETRTHPDARKKESLSQNANLSRNSLKTKGGLKRPLKVCELHCHSSKKFCKFFVPQQSPKTCVLHIPSQLACCLSSCHPHSDSCLKLPDTHTHWSLQR